MDKKTANISVSQRLTTKNLVVVTGLSRSGKSMLAPIVASLKRSESLLTNYTLEQFPVLNYLGEISDHVAIYLMRYMVNIIVYNNAIGRNSNFRLSDWTSVWNTVDPKEFIQRLTEGEGDSVYQKIEKDEQLFVFMFHNALWHSKILFQSFPDLKMIHISRHPVDLIHSWYRRNYGSDFYIKKRSALTLIQNDTMDIPYYTLGWESEYCRLSEMNRIVKMVYKINRNHNESYERLSKKNKRNILLINFDKMVGSSGGYLKEICNFLNTSKSLYTTSVMQRERCPRIINKIDRKNKLEEINDQLSQDNQMLVLEMIEEYES